MIWKAKMTSHSSTESETWQLHHIEGHVVEQGQIEGQQATVLGGPAVHKVGKQLQDPPSSVHIDQHVATVPEGGQDVGHDALVPQPPSSQFGFLWILR